MRLAHLTDNFNGNYRLNRQVSFGDLARGSRLL